MATLRVDRKHEFRRGLSTVEMALMLPILLILTIGIVEYGWALMRSNQLNNAARAGVRMGIRPDATNAQVDALIDAELSRVGMDPGKCTKLFTPSQVDAMAPGETLTIKLTMPYRGDLDLLGTKLPTQPTQISASVGMAKEGPNP